MYRFKLIILLSLLQIGCTRYIKVDKPSNEIEVLKEQTLDIMGRLKIPIRKNIHKDDSLKIITYNGTRFMTCSYGQEAITPYSKQKGVDTLNRWYIKPKLAMSSVLYSIFTKQIDTTKYVYLKALGSIAHELSHYFQNEYVSDKDYIEGTTENYKQHILQPVEIEAYAVDAYYVLNFMNKKLLKKILGMKTSKYELFKTLINEATKIQYPNNPKMLL